MQEKLKFIVSEKMILVSKNFSLKRKTTKILIDYLSTGNFYSLVFLTQSSKCWKEKKNAQFYLVPLVALLVYLKCHFFLHFLKLNFPFWK